MSGKRIAVIGAGVSGLGAIKCCLEEGFDPVCYEQRGGIGGLWNYDSERPAPGLSTVCPVTTSNASKETYCYSDFPYPADFPIFLPPAKMVEYLKLYANAIQLNDCIQYNTEVLSVTQCDDFSNNGRWKIELRNVNTGVTSVEEFDGVLVSNGHHSRPFIPEFEGRDAFRGIQMHSQDLHDEHVFKDKHVVVVGLGSSSIDVTDVVSRTAKKAWLSTRSGAWIFPRWFEGLPLDLQVLRRCTFQLPVALLNWVVERKANSSFDHSLFNIKPKHNILSQLLLISDHIQYDIASGRLIVKPNIMRMTETDVIFDDGTVAKDVDVIVYATGYDVCFPFLRQKEFDLSAGRVDLYKNVFAPDIEPATLAIIGCVDVLGSYLAASEIQSRWAVRIFSGDLKLPSKEEMWKDVEQEEKNQRGFIHKKSCKIFKYYIQYMDEIAELIGCRPNIARMLLTDPKLAFATFFGSCTPAQYRLQGKGAWSGARATILSTWDRVARPLQTRNTSNKNGHNASNFWILFLFATVVLGVLILACDWIT